MTIKRTVLQNLSEDKEVNKVSLTGFWKPPILLKKEREIMSDDPTLDTLKKRIEDAKKTLHTLPSQNEAPSTTLGRLFNVGGELVAGVLAGVAVGLFIDWIFGTSPWGLISLFILGSIAGMMNVYRSLTKTKSK